eukprot:SAG31_NODE_48374_length_192_cov_24.290323_1_plen_34_part_10
MGLALRAVVIDQRSARRRHAPQAFRPHMSTVIVA